MAKLVCFLVCLAVAVSAGSALKCYRCQSDKADGCKKETKPEESVCGNPAPSFQPVCSYKVFYEPKTKQYKVHSGCETIAEGSPMDKRSVGDCDPNNNSLDIKECRVCNKDLCNSAPVFGANLLSLLCLPVMYLFAKYVLN